MHTFVKEFRNAGGKAKFIGFDAQVAFMSMVNDADIWELVDGMLIIKPNGWWNEDSEIVELARSLLIENHPYDVHSIIGSGGGYLAIISLNMILDIVAEAASNIEDDNLNSVDIFNAAEAFSVTVDGVKRDTFSQTKRTSLNYLAVYEFLASERDIFKIDQEPVPILLQP